MVNRANKSKRARVRPGVERLEDRELLSTLLEGVAANDLAGTTVSPVGNIFDDSTSGLVGDDFAIAAPGARSAAGDIYIVFGGPHLNPTPATRLGCINPPTRVLTCSLIDTYLTNRVALRILGDRPGDLAGFSVAGVGNVIGDSRPDVLIGAPFALNAGGESTGRAYLIGGEYIASVISTARTVGGTALATINLASPDPAATFRTFDGLGLGDQAGNSVAGLGQGNFIVGAPRNGAAPKQERGAVYVFTSLRGSTGPGTLSPFTSVLGPSFNAHLGGIPAEELTATGYRGYGVSGIRNPALIPVADELPLEPRYDVIGGFEPDALVGAPDACVDNDCATIDSERHGLSYLLSGTGLITLGGTYDLSVDADLKTLNAIPVQGAGSGDRLGTAVSDAGDIDGDNISDFMFSAPNRDIAGTVGGVSTTDAGEIYVVFGRQVNTTEFPNGQCLGDPGLPGGAQQNFRQCRDAAGLVVPLNVANFSAIGTSVGLILRGAQTNERVGVSLANAGNFVDPVGRFAAALPAQVGVNELLIGAPFHDVLQPAFLQAAGRAYVVFGSRDYRSVSGQTRNLGQIDTANLGQFFDGRTANDHYGSSVSAAGNVHDPIGQPGGDVLVGGNLVDVTLAGVVALDVGEIELHFGATGSAAGTIRPVSPLPFVQPGPFGPQIMVGGYWSFVNSEPPAGSVVQFPLFPSQPSSGLLFPPSTPSMLPAGSIGPFVPAWPFMGVQFIPDKPLALVDRAGNLNVYGGPATPSKGVNVTATLQSPKVKPGSAVVTNQDGSADIFAVDQSGHLIHHQLSYQGLYAVDVTQPTGGPTLTGGVSVQRTGSQNEPSFIVSGRTVSGDLAVYAGSDITGWATANLTQIAGGPSLPLPLPVRGRAGVSAASLSVNYAINGSGHLIEYRPGRRGWLSSDITASARGPLVQGDVSANLFAGGGARATLEVFARGTDGHLVRYYRAGKSGWRVEDISVLVSGGAAASLNGSIVTVSGAFGQRFVYAQVGGSIVEFSSDLSGWRAQALSLPTGVNSVSGPLAATSANGGASRVIYGVSSIGSLVQYSFDGATWTTRLLDSSAGSLATLLDMIADLGITSR